MNSNPGNWSCYSVCLIIDKRGFTLQLKDSPLCLIQPLKGIFRISIGLVRDNPGLGTERAESLDGQRKENQ